MRPPNSPMTPDEFDDALTLATHGQLVTDMGATDDVQAALDAVAQAAPSPPAGLIAAAHAAYAAN